MIGSILMGASTLIGGAGAFAGGLVGGIGTLAGGLTKGIGTLAGGIGKVVKAAPDYLSTVTPAIDLWSQWERQRAEEKIIESGIKLQREKLQAEKAIAMQQVLLANQPSQIQVGQVPAEPAKPGQIIVPAQPAPAEKSNVALFLIPAVILAMILFLKK